MKSNLEDVTKSHHRSISRLIIKNFPRVGPDVTIGHIEQLLVKNVNSYETINYIYVVSPDEKLLGVLSIKELFRKAKDSPVNRFMVKDLVKVSPDTSPAKTAYLALKKGIKEVPVEDDQGNFLGIVTGDTLDSIIYKESRQVLMQQAGLGHVDMIIEDVVKLPITTSIMHRIPWLIFGLVGGLGSARIIDFFSFILEKNLILASFIPLIVYMSGAVSIQIESFIIRDLAINPRLHFKKYFVKQFLILTVIAIVCSVLLYMASLVMHLDLNVSLTLSVALFCAILSSLFTGLFIPYLFHKLKMDPANASGPVATIVQDIISVITYFTIAALLIP